jgi:hypothetical protein
VLKAVEQTKTGKIAPEQGEPLTLIHELSCSAVSLTHILALTQLWG